jgi:hypothetical protein
MFQYARGMASFQECIVSFWLAANLREEFEKAAHVIVRMFEAPTEPGRHLFVCCIKRKIKKKKYLFFCQL